MTTNNDRVPTDERNTAWKIVAKALRTLAKTAEVEIDIDKRLPVQGGLGAGSGNAVAALVGLEVELGRAERYLRSLPKKELPPNLRGAERLGWWSSYRLEIAAMVGSDVPLFLIGGTVLGTDHGQEVYPLPDIKPAIWCVVAIPDVGVSTPQAFRDWDAHWADKGLNVEDGLTANDLNPRIKRLSTVYASVFAGRIPRGADGAGSSGVLSGGEDLAGPNESALVRTGISRLLWNDFEEVVFPQASFPCRNQAHPCGRRNTGGSCTCLVVGVRLSALRVVPNPGRCGKSSCPASEAGPGGGSAEHVDAYLAALDLLG